MQLTKLVIFFFFGYGTKQNLYFDMENIDWKSIKLESELFLFLVC